VISVTVFTGAPCIVMAAFDLEKACRLIQEHRVTFVYVAPPIVLALGKHPIVSKYDLSSVKFMNSGAAPLGKALVEAVWNRLGFGVKQGYGLSETSPTTHTQTIDEFWKFQGSVGKLLPNMEAMIIDEQGKEVAQGEVRNMKSFLLQNEADADAIIARRAAPQGSQRFRRLLEATRPQQGHFYRRWLV
jgi:4-coumarate--CoA ligase